MIELRDLRSFLMVAEELHFGRAAQRLHISPPPLTQRIKALEQELGVLLFKRTRRSVAMTAAGIALVEAARRLVHDVEQVPSIVQRAARGETGQLRAGVSGSALFSQARELQAAVARSLPGVRVVWHELSSMEQIELLHQNRLDLALVSTAVARKGLAVARTIREPFVVALPSGHRLAARRAIALEMLKRETFILGHRHLSPEAYDRVIGACNKAGFSPIVDHQSGHLMTYLSLVAIGAGIALVPASMAHAGMAGVTFVRIQGKAPYSEVFLAWNTANPLPIVGRVLELLDAKG